MQVTARMHIGAALGAAHVAATWLAAARRGQRARRALPATPPPSGTPLVSVLIPAWADADVVPLCMESVRQSTYPRWECIVAAGGPDGTLAAAQSASRNDPRFVVVEQRPRGKNAALNDAYRLAGGTIVVILDADCILEPECLGRLIAPLTRGADAALADYQPVKVTSLSLQFMMDKLSAYRVRGMATLHGGAIAATRTVVDGIGGFPEHVLVGVDWDFDARVAKLGGRRVYVHDARERTPLPSTVREYVKSEIRWRRAHWGWLLANRPATPGEAARWVLAAVPYAVSVAAPGAAALALLMWLVGLGKHGAGMARLLAWYLSWTAARRAAQCVEIAFLTGNPSWLRLGWTPPLTLYLSLGCALGAVVKGPSESPFFKGARHFLAKSLPVRSDA